MSAERGERLNLLAVHNKALLLEQQGKRAHERIDELKASTVKDLEAITKGLGELSVDLKELLAWKNRALGWAAAAIFLSSIMGATLAAAVFRIAFPNPAVAAERVIGPTRK